MLDLPTLPADPACPHAFPIAGASLGQQGVVCRLMQADQDEDAGLRMNPRQLEVTRETQGGVYLNLRSDPSTVTGFCHGQALGRSCDADAGPRAHFTFCPVWEAWEERRRAGKDGLYDEREPESVSMGVSSIDAMDPWAQARADLDVLAPVRA